MSLNSFYCRLCAEQKYIYDLVDLNTNMDTRVEVIGKLKTLLIHYVDFSNKHLPETVCNACMESLHNAHDFFIKIKTSQEFLGEITAVEKDCFIKQEDFIKLKENNVIHSSGKMIYPHNVDVISGLNNEIKLVTLVDCSTWRSYPWHCKYCGVVFESLDILREHGKDVHGVCSAYKCADCDEDVTEIDSFIQHVSQHRHELKNFCHFCNIKLENTTEYDHTHLSKHTCSSCGEQFNNTTELHHHIKQYQKLKRVKKKSSKTMNELLSYGLEFYIPNELNIESWKDYPWICQHCSLKIVDEVTLRNHLKDVHNKCFGMQCVDCTDSLNTFEAFVEHVRRHRPSLRNCCQHCNLKFDNQNSYNVHINEHISFKCDVCDELFQNNTELEKHKAIYIPPKSKRVPFKRRERPITVEDLTCDICHKVTKSLSNLKAHKTLHMERQRNFTCEQCGKAFFTKGALSAHRIIHNNPDPQTCKICKKTFLTLTRLKYHVKTHYEDKPFECTECHKRFRLKEQLKGHMITHTDIMPYPCKYCNKTFRYKNVLKTHENLHTGVRPFACDVCNMTFTNWSNCNKHMKRKHGTTLAKNIMTPQGKLPINPNTGKAKKLKDLETVQEWTQKIMVPCKRGKKTGNDNV